MHYLITGCAGFIGSHLLERLLANGKECVGIDAFTDYYPRSRKEQNLKQARRSKGFKLVEGDLLDCDLEPLIRDAEVVFHLAAQAGVRSSWGKEFRIYTDWNILATQRLLEACRAARRIRVFVYASSSSVYGQTDLLPMREDHLPAPHSPYGVSKLAGEHLCRLYTRNFDLPTVSLRYFTVYGPRQRPDMAFHRFFRAALNGGRIELFGDGSQTRDFTFIDDAVDANLLASARGKPGEVYNIGGGAQVEIRTVIDMMGEIVGKPIPVEYRPTAHGDVTHTRADTSKAAADLDYRPTRELRWGLEEEWKWLKGDGAS